MLPGQPGHAALDPARSRMFWPRAEVVLLLFLKGTGLYGKITPMLGWTVEPPHVFFV